MVSPNQIEKRQEFDAYEEKNHEWVYSICSEIAEKQIILSSIDDEIEEDSDILPGLLKEMGILDIRTISSSDKAASADSSDKWGLVVMSPMEIPESVRPSSNSYYVSEGILKLFGGYDTSVMGGIIGEKVDHRKVSREIRRIASGRRFKDFSIFVMQNKWEIPMGILCLFTFKFNEKGILFNEVKKTEEVYFSDF